jgi:alcohol dehydrogenase
MKGTFSPTSTASGPSSRRSSRPSPFDFQPLGRVVYEPGGLSRLGDFTRPLGRRALLVTDRGLEHAGHPQRAADSLWRAGLEVFTFDGVRENPTEKEVAAGVEFARRHQIDVLVAVGGGSSMDCAKGINFLLTNGGRMADYKGFGKATRPMLASVGVPTTAGTGSEAQSFALITDESSHAKMACGDKKAAFRVAILDPEVTVSQPRTVTAVTGIDAIAHAVESFVCTKANPFSRMCSLAAWSHLEPNFERVLADPGDLAARGAMQLGAHFAGTAIEAAMLGVCHSCANPLSAHYGVTHGVAVGVMLPHVVRFNAPSAGDLFAELIEENGRLNGEPAADSLARRLAGLVREAGLPTTLKECGVSESILPLLAHEANEQWTARFNPRPVTEADIEAIYRAAW